MDFFELLTNPIGVITTCSCGVVFFQAWKLINRILKPLTYVEKLYDIADAIIEQADNNIIDKIRSKKIKEDIQKQVKQILLKRKKKIDLLIKSIAD